MDRRQFMRVGTVLGFAGASGSLRAQESACEKALPKPIASLRNRTAEAVPISLQERETRADRARALMREHGLDAILLAGGTSLTYFTGLRWGNSERMACYVLPARGSAFLVCPAFEEERLREAAGGIPGGANIPLYTWNEDESPYPLVGKGLKQAGLAAGTLGIEERVPFVFADAIAKACPALRIASATPVTAGCRSIKTPAELALMRLACSVTWDVYHAAWQSGHPGMTTKDFAGLIGAGYRQSGFPGEASCQTGIYSALPHGSATPQVIRENSIVMIDDGCIVDGYQSDLTRTFVYGKPTDKMQHVFDIVQRAQTAAHHAARTGSECQQVDTAARDVITAAGFGPDYRTFSHRVGHGIGMDMHEWPYLVRGNTQRLEKNMTFSDEPGIYLKGEFGVRLEDDMVITADGGELMTPQQPSLTDPFGSNR